MSLVDDKWRMKAASNAAVLPPPRSKICRCMNRCEMIEHSAANERS